MRARRDEGFALVTAISFLVIIAVLASTVLILAVSNRRQAANLTRTTQAQYVAEAGIERIVNDYYYQPISGITNASTRTLQKYRKALDTLSFPADDTESGITGQIPYGSGFATYTVSVTRKDDPGKTVGAGGLSPTTNTGASTSLIVTSVGTLPDNTRRVLTQTLMVSNDLFKGFDYALLSNNVNCIFCHSKVTSIEDAYGPANRSALEKVKVATLENLEVRTRSADTFVGGTIYTRGSFRCDTADSSGCSGGNSGNVQTPGNTDIKTYDLNNNQVGTNDSTALANNQDCSSNACTVGQNFYQNYPKGGGADGDVPNDFPPPVDDTNGNRIIDDSEWQAAITDDTGGKLTGGTIGVSQLGKKISAPGAYSGAAQVNTSDSADGVRANLVLTGSDDSPLNISGTVYVDGDVVISGRVKGAGKIIARGNVYVVGDLQYDCTDTQRQRDCDYSKTSTLPQFGLVAGGNIAVGDYLTPRTHYGNTSASTYGNWSLDSTGKTALNDTNILTDPTVIEPAYDKASNKNSTAKVPQDSGSPKTVKDTNNKTIKLKDVAPSFVAAEVAVFNNNEYQKWVKDATYKPRFYKLRDSDSQPFYYTGTGEKPETYNDVADVPTAAQNAGVVLSVSPNDDWISENKLKQKWIDNVESPSRTAASNKSRFLRTDQNKPLQIDGLLYSSNATFALARGQSQIQGSTVINGALVSADTGILSSGKNWGNGTRVGSGNGQMNPGLSLHYDARLRGLIKLKSALILGRSDYQFRDENGK